MNHGPWSGRLAIVAAVAVAALCWPAQGRLAGVALGAERRCFAETPHCVEGAFLAYWERHGGLAVFGYPITAAGDEYNFEVDPPALRRTQWFERARLELHPENQPPYDVLLGRLGASALREIGIDWAAQPKAPGPRDGCVWFAETGHNACDQAPGAGFKSYWQSHGLEFDGQPGVSHAESLALFGLPLTEPKMETNTSGDTVLTQWFERARFEWHPTNPNPFKVLLGLLGDQVRQPFTAVSNPGLGGELILVTNGGNFSVRADGSEVSRIGDWNMNGAISPDGKKFLTSGCDRQPGLCVTDREGATERRLNDDPQAWPVGWSPDGRRILYRSAIHDPDNMALFVAAADGSGLIQLAPHTPRTIDIKADWSAATNKIAYGAIINSAGNSAESPIYVINPDGTGKRMIVAHGLDPVWSPDGKRVAYLAPSEGGFVLHAVDVSTGVAIRLGERGDSPLNWSWAPDSRALICQGELDGHDAIWSIQADGGGRKPILTGFPADLRPQAMGIYAQSPDQTYLVVSLSYPDAPRVTRVVALKYDGSQIIPLVSIKADSAIYPTEQLYLVVRAWLPD